MTTAIAEPKPQDDGMPVPSDLMMDAQPGQSPGLVSMADKFKQLGGEWLMADHTATTAPVATPEPPKQDAQPPAPPAKTEPAKVDPPKADPPKVDPPKPKDPFDFAKPAEAPKPPVKTDDVPDEIKSSAARERFKQLEADRNAHLSRADQAESKLKAMEAEIQKIKSKTVDSEALESLRKENEDLSKRISIMDVTQHPKFQQYFGGKERQISEQIASAAGPELSKTVLNLLNGPDTQERANMLAETVSQLPIWNQNKITAYAIQLDQLRAEREAAIADASKARETLLLEKDSIQKAERQERDSKFNRVLAQAQDPKQGLEALMPKDGDEAHNATVRAAIEQARLIVSGELPPEDLSRAALWAAAAPIYRDAVFAQKALIDKLEAQVKGMQSASPTLSGKAGESTPVEATDFTSKFMQAYNSIPKGRS
jgi:hypothetical protein